MKFIDEIIKTKTISHSIITFSGTAINGVLGLLFFIFLARFLGPEKFGIISISIVILTLVADISDIGINTGIINFVGRMITKDKAGAYRIMKLGLKYKLISWSIVLITGFFFADSIAIYLFQKPELGDYLKYSFLGVGGALLFSFVTNCLQAYQKYIQWSILNILLNAVRLLVVLILALIGTLDTLPALFTYLLMPFLGFFVGLLLLPKKFLLVKNEGLELKSFLSYNKWVALSIILAAVSSRVDTFFTARFLTITEAGFYQVAVQITSIVPQAVYALAVVVAPKLAGMSSSTEAFKYLKKLQILTIGIALIGLFAIPFSFFLIPLFYSEIYERSIAPFSILLLAQLVFLISIPAHQAIFYYFSRPGLFVCILLIQLILTIILSVNLIPIYGSNGAAISVLSGSIFNFLTTSYLILKKFNKL